MNLSNDRIDHSVEALEFESTQLDFGPFCYCTDDEDGFWFETQLCEENRDRDGWGGCAEGKECDVEAHNTNHIIEARSIGAGGVKVLKFIEDDTAKEFGFGKSKCPVIEVFLSSVVSRNDDNANGEEVNRVRASGRPDRDLETQVKALIIDVLLACYKGDDNDGNSWSER